ncbi:MAG: hypothetical protein JO252_03260, partial [Planctomycetaceae bacterium]|nr:hypothetical protein [Planctomycetaceae bacterium]
LTAMLEPGGLALIADPYRAAAEGFRRALADRGLSCEVEPIAAETGELGSLRGTLHRVRVGESPR